MSWVYWAPKSRMSTFWCLLDPVIWRLLDDLHVVDVRFADTRGSDLDELTTLAKLVDRRVARVAHACPQATHQLLDHPDGAALVGDASFHAFGHQLVDVHVRVLEIAIGGALLHGAERPHATVGLV